MLVRKITSQYLLFINWENKAPFLMDFYKSIMLGTNSWVFLKLHFAIQKGTISQRSVRQKIRQKLIIVIHPRRG